MATPKPKTAKKATPKAEVPNEWGSEMPDVDQDLYKEEMRQSFPSAAWIGSYKGEGVETGVWTIDREAIEAMPGPAGFWREGRVRFGRDPNTPATPVYMADTLRCVPIGFRARQIHTDEITKRETYYHQYESRDNRKPGRVKMHYQVMVCLPDLPVDEPIVLGLKSMYSTLSWDHNGKYMSDFPVGVKQLLQEYIDGAPDPYCTLPLFCAWDIDLHGVYESGEKYYVAVGPNEETYVQPFTVDLRTRSSLTPAQLKDERFDSVPASRYVGRERYEQYEQVRRDIALDWEAEWSRDSIGSAAQTTPSAPEAMGDEEDDLDDLAF